MDLKEDALKYHEGIIGRPGKIGTKILTSVKDRKDLSLAYSPGVAAPCLEIEKDKNKIYNYTSKGNSVAIISNGTAVLGLGNIGAKASKPVMEGKALLFKHFGRIDATDIEIDSENVDEVIRTVELIGETYGGINLEDIKAPECFEVETRLKKKMNIPIFHDDQHGTAIVVSAGLLNALEIANKKIENIKIIINGAGSAGIAIGKLLLKIGAVKENIAMCDSKGVIYTGREADKSKKEFAIETEKRTMEEVVVESDVFIGVSLKDLLTTEMLKSMNDNPIIFALANPDPEIKWELAHETRDDIIMATGRSDYPNQVNNVLAFPGIFRGALDVRASEINEEMKIAAVKALSKLCDNGKEKQIIPDVFDKRIVVEVAFNVAQAAIKSNVAKSDFNLKNYRENLEKRFL